MELYTLDSLLRRESVIDKFESLIWTERFSSAGDFQLIVKSTNATRSLLVEDTKLALNQSTRVMEVKTVEDTLNEEGQATLKVTGTSLESVLDDRLAVSTLAIQPDPPAGSPDTTDPNAWVLIGTPRQVALQMFQTVCVDGAISPMDIIPFYSTGDIYPASTILDPQDLITWSQDVDTLYNAIKGVCDLFGLGFRFSRFADHSQLFFNIYSGNDHTTSQTQNPPVVFSPDLDNLTNTTEIRTTADAKNVIHVFTPRGVHTVTAAGAGDEEGFERRVGFVNANDLTGDDWQSKAEQLGQQELAKHRKLKLFDGEFNQSSTYRYGRDYELGDLVEMRNVDGIRNHMRVTEQIFVSDKEGERAYPTLEVAISVEPGTWAAQAGRVWVDYGDTEYWGTQE